MIRKALYAIACLGALLSLVAWELSNRYCAGAAVWYSDRSELFVVVEGGAFTVERLRDFGSTGGSVSRYEWGVSTIEHRDPLCLTSQELFGDNVCGSFYWYRCDLCSQAWDADGSYTVRVPFWLISLGFLSVPLFAFSFLAIYRFWRRRRNQCVTCGYSLEGNVSGVCPECGAKCVRGKYGQPEDLRRDS